jgi:beta-N-acetylhexosaminidase
MNFFKIKLSFRILLLIIFLFSIVYLYLSLNNNMDTNTDNIIIKEKQINLDSLTVKQKIAQMIIIRGDDKKNLISTNLNIGGIFLDKLESEENYINLINEYQNNSKILLFVSTDLEGAWNPFKFIEFPYFSEINSSKVSYEVGLEHGKILKDIGFNINFAPVAEFIDQSYGGGRVFIGTKKEIEDKLASYIKGLQENTYGTCKHYPGKGMLNNLHLKIDSQIIDRDDLELFEMCFKNNISAVIVGHQITTGVIDSKGKPSSVSPEVISTIPDDKLIISDEVNMNGIKYFYKDKTAMYTDLINSGENIILDFQLDYFELVRLLDKLEKKVSSGDISLDKIDSSVEKILVMKGYKVVQDKNQ